jgi:hypothetical protein
MLHVQSSRLETENQIALLENWMGKRKSRSSYEYNHTSVTLLTALFGGVCAFIAVETTLPDLIESWGRQMDKLPGWQLHMGSVCGGIITFFTFLFILEALETKSRITAWRSSAPWLPLVGLTLLATIIHIPYFVVIVAGAIYGVWAYRQTSSVRRSSHLP